ncbi:hypothetical protein [Pseudozobellia thermophila]|uniref:Uncharacterized protein n=1 Tax=Pseudozobellia thermophila TaxID=192903 RepID=A0A1M6P641_9FLAO|nr:hypothetical protein [Pseudozobellia thermophila]SHK03346.1 hypothetical protein SAMN04488513_11824 [Pseudozobellia thermophila]
MHITRLRKRQGLESVLRAEKLSLLLDSESDDNETKPKPNKKLSQKARMRLKNVKANEKFREMQTMARDNTMVKPRLINYQILKPITSEINGIEGEDLIKGAILLYGISEGASGTIYDFDKILQALKNDTFLSREFNAQGELREYKLNPDGSPKYNGGGRGKVKPEEVAKAAKKFKFNAKLVKGVKNLGHVANGVGLLFTTMESYEDGEITALEAMDILMGVIAFVPPHGWIISGSWSIMRMTVPEKGTYGIEMDNGIRRFGEW